MQQKRFLLHTAAGELWRGAEGRAGGRRRLERVGAAGRRRRGRGAAAETRVRRRRGRHHARPEPRPAATGRRRRRRLLLGHHARLLAALGAPVLEPAHRHISVHER